jgi:hypothetical protein
VCVKVENKKINIRVGGGYMRIEEFLEKYTMLEVEKNERTETQVDNNGVISQMKRGSSPMKQQR